MSRRLSNASEGQDDDWDLISLTSTQASEGAEEYPVEDILAEGENEDGDAVYLIKWENYPLHRCTWEPEAHVVDLELFAAWEQKRRRAETGRMSGFSSFEEYNDDHIARFEEACADFEEGKERRRKIRELKRAELGRAATSKARAKKVKIGDDRAYDSEDSDDVPLVRSSKLRRLKDSRYTVNDEEDEDRQAQSLFVRESRRSSIDRPFADDLSLEPSSNAASKPQSTGPATTALSCQSKATSKELSKKHLSNHVEGNRNGTRAGPVQVPHPLPKASDAPSTIRTSKASGDSNPTVSRNRAPGAAHIDTASTHPNPNKPVTASTTMTRKTAAPLMKRTGAITFNMSKVVPKRSGWTQGKNFFNKVRYARKAELRGREEPAPELSALQFVNKTSRDRANGTGDQQNGRGSSLDSPVESSSEQRLREIYGRRGFDVAARRDGRQSWDDNESPGDDQLLADWEKDKIPETCWEWVNNTCGFKATECRFLHRRGPNLGIAMNGHIKGKYRKPPLTCNPWMKDPKGCSKSPEECDFAHYNTGWLAIFNAKEIKINETEEPASKRSAPSSTDLTCFFWLRHPQGCTRPERQCNFSHRNTGWLAVPKSAPIPIDPAEEPESSKSTTGKSEVHCQHPSQGATTLLPKSQRVQLADRNAGYLAAIGEPPVQIQTTQAQVFAPPKSRGIQRKTTTCHYWAKGYCKYSESQCLFAHCSTGHDSLKTRLEGEWRPDIPDSIIQSPLPLPPSPSPVEMSLSLGHQGVPPDATTIPTRALRTSFSLPTNDPQRLESVEVELHGFESAVMDRLEAAFGGRNDFTVSHCCHPYDWKTVVSEARHLGVGSVFPTDLSSALLDHYTSWLELQCAGAVIHDEKFTLMLFTPKSMTWDLNSVPQRYQFPPIRRLAFQYTEPIAAPCNLPGEPMSVDVEAFTAKSLKLDSTQLFGWHSGKKLQRRVFLLFDTVEHREELELLMRYFHTERASIYHLGIPGSWERFCQPELDGHQDEGVVLISSSLMNYAVIPNLRYCLTHSYNVFQLGAPKGKEQGYGCTRLFPHGTVVLITDDVFEGLPKEACKLMEAFFNKSWKSKESYQRNSRLFARPGLTKFIRESVESTADNEPRMTELVQLYQWVHRLAPPENEPISSYLRREDDTTAIVSMREGCLAGLDALRRGNPLEATEKVVNLFAGWALTKVHRYRRFVIVHTQKQKHKLGWMDQYNHILEVRTPEDCMRRYFKEGIKK